MPAASSMACTVETLLGMSLFFLSLMPKNTQLIAHVQLLRIFPLHREFSPPLFHQVIAANVYRVVSQAVNPSTLVSLWATSTC